MGHNHQLTKLLSDDSLVGQKPVRSSIDDQEAELADRQSTLESNRKSSDLRVPELSLSHIPMDLFMFRTCYAVTDLLRGNWCSGFWPLLSIIVYR